MLYADKRFFKTVQKFRKCLPLKWKLKATFYTVIFLVFWLADSSMTLPKTTSSVNCHSIENMNSSTPKCSWQILSNSWPVLLRKTPPTGSNTNSDWGKFRSIITMFGEELKRLDFVRNCKGSRGPSFHVCVPPSAATLTKCRSLFLKARNSSLSMSSWSHLFDTHNDHPGRHISQKH